MPGYPLDQLPAQFQRPTVLMVSPVHLVWVRKNPLLSVPSTHSGSIPCPSLVPSSPTVGGAVSTPSWSSLSFTCTPNSFHLPKAVSLNSYQFSSQGWSRDPYRYCRSFCSSTSQRFSRRLDCCYLHHGTWRWRDKIERLSVDC